MTFNDYPKAATENAKRALKFREDTDNKNGCGTPVGWARANQLAKRENISLDTVKRMSAFNRHRQNKDVPYKDGCGGLMWDAWGGTEGIDWAKRKVEQIEKEQMENSFKFEILTDVYDNGLEVQRLSNLLEEAEGDKVVINIASDGGEVFLGLKLAALISNYKGETEANIYGFAASISTILATAATKSYISRFSLFMIHNAWKFLKGNKEELQRQNKTLEEIDSLLASMYVDKMRRSGTLINESKEESLVFVRELIEPRK
jgi:ATP-dependent protease ClpP protease subunit